MAILGLAGVWFPQFFGNGYDTVNQVLNGSDQMPLKVLIALPILKIVVTGLCRSGGVPGGLFTPSLFVGALLGTAFGVGVNAICPGGAVAKPGAYALVGMGAILAGTIQAPITAILMIFEMTRDYEIIVPLMSACAASAVVSHLFQESSIFTEPLRRRGIRLPQAYAPTWMRQPTVRSVMQPDMATVFRRAIPASRGQPPPGARTRPDLRRTAREASTISSTIKRFFRRPSTRLGHRRRHRQSVRPVVYADRSRRGRRNAGRERQRAIARPRRPRAKEAHRHRVEAKPARRVHGDEPRARRQRRERRVAPAAIPRRSCAQALNTSRIT